MFKLITAEDIKLLTKGEFGDVFNPLLDDLIIPAVGQMFASYCGRPDFDRKSRIEYFSPGWHQRSLFVSSPPVTTNLKTSIRNGIYKWTASPAGGTGVYYCEAAAGGSPSLSSPSGVQANDVDMTLALAVGSITAGKYWYGDGDTLGYNTVYVHLSDSADPDGKANDYVLHLTSTPLQVWQDTSSPRAYGSDTLLAEGDDYWLFEEAGRIEKETCFPHGFKTVKVSYTGGYLTGDGKDCPGDLKLAATIQAKLIFDRREELGLTGRSLEGGSMSLLVPMLLPRNVTGLLDSYRTFFQG